MSSEKLRAPGTAGWYCTCGARNVVTIQTRDDLRRASCRVCGQSADLVLEPKVKP